MISAVRCKCLETYLLDLLLQQMKVSDLLTSINNDSSTVSIPFEIRSSGNGRSALYVLTAVERLTSFEQRIVRARPSNPVAIMRKTVDL